MTLDKQKLDLAAAGLAATSWTLPTILSATASALAIVWGLVRLYDRFFGSRRPESSQ